MLCWALTSRLLAFLIPHSYRRPGRLLPGVQSCKFLHLSPFWLVLAAGFCPTPVHGAARSRRHDFGDVVQDFLTSFARGGGASWTTLDALGTPRPLGRCLGPFVAFLDACELEV